MCVYDVLVLFTDAVTNFQRLTRSVSTTPINITLPATTNSSNPNETPQVHIFSFPDTTGITVGHHQKQIAIATTRPHNVTLYVSTYFEVGTVRVRNYGPFVISNSSEALVVPMTGSVAHSSVVLSVNVSSSDKINVYAYLFFEYNVDALLVRDVSQLGSYYEVMTLPIKASQDKVSKQRKSFFVVTASEDNTTLQIWKQQDLSVALSSFSFSMPHQVS